MRVQCPRCGYADDSDCFDCMFVCISGNVICNTCHVEFDPMTGEPHIHDRTSKACNNFAKATGFTEFGYRGG